MSRDKIQGFMLGLAAGFLSATVLKSPEQLTASRGDRVADRGTTRNDTAKNASPSNRELNEGKQKTLRAST